jgi:hypothetical protein
MFIYQRHVKAFFDGLLPFYPSPLRDDGQDIAD